ncbi:MAG: Chromate transport protein [Alphaproteobacteria bacterium ADurb.BinA305]|nr:MAG: Chromate transport protein [Alphaproteobacteria bacterium ADurb.BinA305]
MRGVTGAMERVGESEAIGAAPRVSFGAAFRIWLKIGLLSFGGPAGQIATMHRILVDEKKWIGEARFLHALNYCMVLPGPEAQQLATYIGWMLHRTAGGLTAGILFVMPGAFVILALSTIYAGFHKVALVQAVFFGIKAAVLAVVIEALLRIAMRALKNSWMYALAATAFVGIFFLDIPFPLIVIAAGLIGYFGGKLRPGQRVSFAGEAVELVEEGAG